MLPFSRFSIFFMVVVFLFSCQRDELPDDHDHPQHFGYVTGKVYTANGIKVIANVSVFVDAEGEIYHTFSRMDGSFIMKVPVGSHDLHIQAGDGSKFRSIQPIDVIEDDTTDLISNGINLRLNQTANLAYVWGGYDAIESIIIDTLGFTATQISVQDLKDISVMAQYDAIFLNCNPSTVDDTISQNLGIYTASGGSLYASDWAVSYLMGEPTTSCPQAKPFGFIDDNTLCTSRLGMGNADVTGAVVSNDIQQYLGKSWTDLHYDLASWESVQSIDLSFWEVMIEDSASQDPLMIRSSQFGQAWTTVSLDTSVIIGNPSSQWVTICHIPPGNTSNPVTITVSVNSLQTHLAHGDYLGSCQGGNSGNIYFTTFHNEPNGQNTRDVTSILEYIILNI